MGQPIEVNSRLSLYFDYYNVIKSSSLLQESTCPEACACPLLLTGSRIVFLHDSSTLRQEQMLSSSLYFIMRAISIKVNLTLVSIPVLANTHHYLSITLVFS
jgi:hypothetical protein